MALPLYLAMTAAEMAGNPDRPDFFAYMACHFSPGGTGLSNAPARMNEHSLLILDDSTPMDGHAPQQILSELKKLIERDGCMGLLLDFQRPKIPEQQELAEFLCAALPCPVAVSELYAASLSCPVFLPPAPADTALADYLKPWQGREIWLDAAMDGIELKLTVKGCNAAPLPDFPDQGHSDKGLHCHYTVETKLESAIFRLWRTRKDLVALLSEAEVLGVAKAVGLWQELGCLEWKGKPATNTTAGPSIPI